MTFQNLSANHPVAVARLPLGKDQAMEKGNGVSTPSVETHTNNNNVHEQMLLQRKEDEKQRKEDEAPCSCSKTTVGYGSNYGERKCSFKT